MPNRSVVVSELWEEFRISEERVHTFKEALSRLRLAWGTKSVWGLTDVSVTINKGETVGVIGPNGSGKSTLLRCIAGILAPTKGEVLVNGTVSSLIELGAGFHPELTGRENAAVTASLFGINRKQLAERWNSIVEFAGLEEVIDRPVRAYSSGMHVRLAFSLAVHVEPDIFLVDEVLAVGDELFQRQCLDKVESLASRGGTIIFVSHELALVRRVCKRTILLEEGRVVADGSTESVIGRYMASLNKPAKE